MPNWRIHLLNASRQPAAPGKPSTWPVNHTANTPLNIPNCSKTNQSLPFMTICCVSPLTNWSILNLVHAVRVLTKFCAVLASPTWNRSLLFLSTTGVIHAVANKATLVQCWCVAMVSWACDDQTLNAADQRPLTQPLISVAEIQSFQRLSAAICSTPNSCSQFCRTWTPEKSTGLIRRPQ